MFQNSKTKSFKNTPLFVFSASKGGGEWEGAGRHFKEPLNSLLCPSDSSFYPFCKKSNFVPLGFELVIKIQECFFRR